jgi:4-aminobutyrate aminotransferase
MPLSRSLYERESQSLAAIERLRFFPLEVVEGRGCWLVEPGGRHLLDLSATWSAAGLGYSHPAVQMAIAEAVRNMAGAGVGSICSPEPVNLAEELLATIPGSGDRRVYLGHSGSDANEASVRAIRRATGRQRLVAFHGSYHGGLAGSSQFSGLMVDSGQPADRGLTLITYPDAMKAGDLEASLLELDAALLPDYAGDVPAAVIVEPIMSDGGLIVPPPGFLKAMHERCARDGVLLICDEVKVGLGRTGTLHAFAADGVVPDVITFGKSLGGGLPISAAVGPAEIMNVADAFTMLTTAGNPICSAAARAVLRTIISDDLPAQAAIRGEQFHRELIALQARHPMVTAVRGRGLAIGIELGGTERTSEPGPSTAAKVVYQAWKLGLVLFYVGRHSNVLELTPPLVINEAEVRIAVEILDHAIADVERGLVGDEAVANFAGW